jgi:hypothetical protein
MIASIHSIARALYPKRPSWEALWHPWTVVIPRRSITGRLVWGTVWRRRNGRRWIYKQHIGTATGSINGGEKLKAQVDTVEARRQLVASRN